VERPLTLETRRLRRVPEVERTGIEPVTSSLQSLDTRKPSEDDSRHIAPDASRMQGLRRVGPQRPHGFVSRGFSSTWRQPGISVSNMTTP
jgi:hypothetical protein